MNLIEKITSGIVKPVTNLVGKFIPDKDLAEKLSNSLESLIITSSGSIIEKEIQARANIIIAEAQGDSWLQRNWRPLLMLWFAVLIGAYWLGWTAPNLPESAVNNLLDIVKVGVGGYVIGRSGEKIIKTWKQKNIREV